MQSAKQEAKTMIDGLPEDASFEDIQYHLYILEKINAGIESIETQGGISHEEAKNRFEKWLKERKATRALVETGLALVEQNAPAISSGAVHQWLGEDGNKPFPKV